MVKIAKWMEEVAKLCQKANADGIKDLETTYPEELAAIREEVKTLALKFPVPTLIFSENL